jgi:multidrug efflux pump subunit AcrB
MNFARLVDHQWRAVVVVMVLLSVGGLIAMRRVPMALFPETNFPRIIIVIENGEVPAQQMLVTVTKPVEEAMSGMPGITRVKSITSRGAAEIDLFFDWRSDIQQTLQMVQSRVSGLATTLPPTARVTRVERLTFAVFPIIGYSVTSARRDPGTLRTLSELTIRPPLARVPGVASVVVQGGEIREYHVNLDPARLESRGLTVSQVADALKNTNVIDSPGLIDENHHLELALVSGQAKSIDDITHIVVANVNNVPVMLSDVATVEPGFEPRYTIVTADGKPAVLVNVLRQPTANTAAVVDAVKQELDALKPLLPRDVEIKPFYDQ